MAVLVAVGGCGDEGPTKQEFIAQADRICADLDRRAERLARPPRSPDGLVRFSQETTRLVRDAVRRLGALELPENEQDRAGAQRYIDSVKASEGPASRLEQSSRRLEAAVEQRDRAAVQAAAVELQAALQEIQRTGDRSERAARQYGLTRCAE